MATEKSLYNRVNVPAGQTTLTPLESRSYKGLSTVSADSNSFALYDINLIKQDIINHFHIRQGEKLENPEFGTIIWELLFDPLTEDVKNLIIENVKTVINSDPRVKTDQVTVSVYETGIQVECELTYLPYNISEALRFKFDQDNNIFS
jgi:phage baseplate assembly protein W